MNIDDIRKLLPHRYPFLLVDKVLEYEVDTSIVAIKNVSANEPFFQGHFPDYPVMPGVLLIEALAQVGAILDVLSREEGKTEKLMFLVGVNRVKFKEQIRPGDQLRLEVKAGRKRGDFVTFNGTVYVGRGEPMTATIAATAEINGMCVNPNG